MKCNYKPKLSVESTDKYEKARDDLIEAIKSFDELSQQQQKKLVGEVFGYGAVVYIQKLMRRRY